MKILFISMPSIHVIRWVENLKYSRHELYWFDVLARGKLNTCVIPTNNQFLNWQKRKLPYIKGEYFLSKKTPVLYHSVQQFFEVTVNEKLEEIMNTIKPDVVHSFEMQSCSYPILKTMKKYNHIPWLYSCWGSDLFYYATIPSHKIKIKNVLKRVDYLHTDCTRDYKLAKQLGFKGNYVGTIPGGGGYDFGGVEKDSKRNYILVKGYEHKFGRSLVVVKALQELLPSLGAFNVVVFGAHPNVVSYIEKNKLPFQFYGRHDLKHEEVLNVMSKSKIYIGNSISDGLPNTLLEAMAMGVFPIQSNPGNATEELITHNVNGLLIENPESVECVKQLVLKVLGDGLLLEKCISKNREIIRNYLDYNLNNKKIVGIYQAIEGNA